jgi:VanZ family protein
VSHLPLKRSGLFILALILTTAILLGIQLPGDNRLIYSIQDSGHFLIFTLLTLTALWPYRKMHNRPVWPVMSLIFLFGLLIEVVQSFIGRKASLYDLLMDLLGMAAGGVLYAGIIRRTFSTPLSIVILLLFSLAAFSLPIYWLTVYQSRAGQFPRLIDPGNFFSRALIDGSMGGEVRHIEVPNDWLMPTDPGFDSCAYVSLHEGRWPGLQVQEPAPDWRGYETLEVGIYSDQLTDLPLHLRIHDQSHGNQLEDRYNRRLLVHPGYNQYSFPLSEIEQAPKARVMDLSEISNVIIHASHEDVGKGFCLITMGLQ